MTARHTLLLLGASCSLVLSSVLVVGCTSTGSQRALIEPEPTPKVISDPEAKRKKLEQLSAKDGGVEMPGGGAPMMSREGQQAPAGGSAAPAASGEALVAQEDGSFLVKGLPVRLPAEWEFQQPSSAMRIFQASLPGSGGFAELTVFHGFGGGVEANLQRWIAQIELEPGTEPQQAHLHGSLHTTWVYVTGTLKPSGMGTGPSEPTPNSAILGAVVEGEGGPWYFKFTGPKATLSERKEEILGFLGGLVVPGGAGNASDYHPK